MGAGALLLLAGALPVLRAADDGAEGGSGAEPVAEARALPVRAGAPRPAEGYRRRFAYPGELEFRREAALAWESPGRVLDVAVDEGARVAAGDLLATLESDRARAQLDALVAQRAREAARLAELEAGPRAQTIEVARAEVARLEAGRDLAVSERDRAVELWERDSVSEAERDAAVAAELAAAARLAAARHALEEFEEGTRAEELDRQRAVVAQLEAQVELARIELADRELRAPFAGVVTLRGIDEGDVVAAGDPAFELAEVGALEARIGVPAIRLEQLGALERVTLEVRGETVEAVVRATVPRLDDGTRTADVIVALDADDSPRFVAGEVAKLVVEVDVSQEGFWIPRTALVPGARGTWSAYALAGADLRRATVVRRDVAVLWTEGDLALVEGQLDGEDRIVLEGIDRVVPDQVVDAVGGVGR